MSAIAQSDEKPGVIIGKNWYRDVTVNEGHYSQKRPGVADVDPKVSTYFSSNSLFSQISLLYR